MENNSEKSIKISKKWIIALCLLAFGTTLYSEIEGHWLSSFARYIAGISYFQVAVIFAISGILSSIFYLIWGAISDNTRTKLGRRVPLILIGTFSTALLLILFTLTVNFFILLIIGGILLAITSNMVHVTNKSLIADLIPQERRGRVISIIFFAGVMASLAAWIPAIFLLPEGQESYSLEIHVAFIWGCALIFAIIGILVLLLVKEPKITTLKSSWIKDIKLLLDIEEMKHHKGFLRLFIAMLFLIMSQNAFFPFLLILIQEIPIEIDLIFIIELAIIGVVILLSIFLIGKYADTHGRKRAALICLILFPIGSFIITFSNSNLNVLFAGFGIMMGFNTGLWIVTDAWTQDLLPEASRGRFLGIINIGNAIGKVPGVLIAGYLADTLGLLWVFFVAGVITLISIPFFMKVPETIISNNENLKESIDK